MKIPEADKTIMRMKFPNPANQPRLKIGESDAILLKFLLLQVVKHQQGSGYVSMIAKPTPVREADRTTKETSLNELVKESDVFERVRVRKNGGLKFYFKSAPLQNADMMREVLRVLNMDVSLLR